MCALFTFTTKSLPPSGKVCGNVFPAPLLVESDQATITFVSDGSNTGRGFELTFTAVHKESEAGDLAYTVETPLLSFLTPLKLKAILSLPGNLKNQVVGVSFLKAVCNPSC